MKNILLLVWMLCLFSPVALGQGFVEYTQMLNGRTAIPPNDSTRWVRTDIRLYDYGSFGGAVGIQQWTDVLSVAMYRSTSVEALGTHLFNFEPGPIDEFGRGWGYSQILRPSEIADVRAGNWWVVVFTPGFPDGEIRGQLAAVPEPGAYALFAVGCAGFWFYRRRARQ